MKETGTIFDLAQPDPGEGQEGYMEIAARAPSPKDNSFFNVAKEYGKTAIKGLTEGFGRLGSVTGPLIADIPLKDYSKELTSQLEERFPTEGEGFGQKALRRASKELPSALTFGFGGPLGTAARVGAGALGGQFVESLGGPEWAQSAAELTAYIGPDLTRKLLSSGKNKELIDAARKFGMTDNQIAPLIQSENKQRWLSKISSKIGSTQERLKQSYKGIGDSYNALRDSPAGKTRISPVQTESLIESLDDVLKKMPNSVRQKIKGDMKDLIDTPMTGESLMNFYADINHELRGNTKQLSLLKEPITKAIGSISPEFAKDFENVNKLRTRFGAISSRLKPQLHDQIINAVESLGVAAGAIKGLLFGDYTWLVGALGEKAGRKLASEMLTNPRLQQLGKKMVVAINENKYPLALKVTEDMRREMENLSGGSSKYLPSLSMEEWEKISG